VVRFCCAIHATCIILILFPLPENTILHPKCVIECSPGCEIIIGQGNVIEECVHINFFSSKQAKFIIGDYNHFQAKSKIYSPKRIGSRNTFEPFAVVKENSFVQDNCNINAHCIVRTGVTVLSNSTVLGPNSEIILHHRSALHGHSEQDIHVVKMKKLIEYLKIELKHLMLAINPSHAQHHQLHAVAASGSSPSSSAPSLATSLLMQQQQSASSHLAHHLHVGATGQQQHGANNNQPSSLLTSSFTPSLGTPLSASGSIFTTTTPTSSNPFLSRASAGYNPGSLSSSNSLPVLQSPLTASIPLNLGGNGTNTSNAASPIIPPASTTPTPHQSLGSAVRNVGPLLRQLSGNLSSLLTPRQLPSHLHIMTNSSATSTTPPSTTSNHDNSTTQQKPQ